MKKIRINELARELEVKSREVLDRLKELGVTETLTHSSSIDEDTAIRLRRHYGLDVPDAEPSEPAPEATSPDAAPEPAAEAKPSTAPAPRAETPAEPAPAAKEERPAAEEPALRPAGGTATAPIRP